MLTGLILGEVVILCEGLNTRPRKDPPGETRDLLGVVGDLLGVVGEFGALVDLILDLPLLDRLVLIIDDWDDDGKSF